jgi:hypothetical protein
MQFSKHTPLPPYPNHNFILARRICVPRDQPQPGSYLNKREEPGNEVDTRPGSHPRDEFHHAFT